MKNKVIEKMARESVKKVAIGLATHYANVSCPLILNQPEMKESVRSLRRIRKSNM